MKEFINKDILNYVELNSQQEPTLLKELMDSQFSTTTVIPSI